MDMGERRFSFRITADQNIDRAAQAFNEEPFALSFFPSGEGQRPVPAVTLDNEKILLSSMRKTDNGYQITLYNTTIKPETVHVSIPTLGYNETLEFGRYELKIIDI
jgi:alpha-mannosidase